MIALMLAAAICNAEVCPERQNDFCWENDKFGMRAYGPGENSGNYLVLHCTTPGVEAATITSEVIGGVHGPVTLDEDGIVISRITDKDTQTIEVVAYKDGESDSVTLDLSNLVLESQAQNDNSESGQE